MAMKINAKVVGYGPDPGRTKALVNVIVEFSGATESMTLTVGHCAKRWRRSRPPRTRHCKSKGLRAAVCSRPTLGGATGAGAAETLGLRSH
jgi:hypothetical protein